MLSRLLRRLQGRPTPAHDDARDADGVEPSADAPAGDAARALAPAELRARGLRWLLDVHPEAAPEPEAGAQALAYLEPVAQRLDPRRLPRLPALVPQLLAALRREDVDAQALAALIARDPTLAGGVMRVANSAFHRRANPATGLAQAVAVLGADGLRHVVFTSVMRPILRPDPRSAVAARLWRLTEARTWMCARLAVGRHEVAEAQLAAVVASTGAGALLSMVPAPILVPASTDPAFVQGFDAIARAVTVRAASHWQLAQPVVDALRDAEGGAMPLAAILRSGDLLAIGSALGHAGRLGAGETACGVDGMLGTRGEHAALIAALDAEREFADVDSAA